MFYGLNKFIKNLLPKQLFYRALLIVATPIIILQITISVVFLDSLWIKTNVGMTRALVGEIKTFIDSYNKEDADRNFLENTFEEHLNINVIYFQNKEFSNITRSVQIYLSATGHYNGVISSNIDDELTIAITMYQRKNNLEVTGSLSDELIKHINVSI